MGRVRVRTLILLTIASACVGVALPYIELLLQWGLFKGTMIQVPAGLTLGTGAGAEHRNSDQFSEVFAVFGYPEPEEERGEYDNFQRKVKLDIGNYPEAVLRIFERADGLVTRGEIISMDWNYALVVRKVGWPYRSVYMAYPYNPLLPPKSFADSSSWRVFLESRRFVFVPRGVFWKGLFANVGLVVALTLGTVVCYIYVRDSRRNALGKCWNCTYEVAGLQRCSECNSVQPQSNWLHEAARATKRTAAGSWRWLTR